ncbi:uncharacterized protein BDW47DRAFT_119173 [Aspergillus candidus]|uniref:O-methyltransferase C-terminal domain-containing protein n=1 Tax=Aspergillus candidus TaxID=41067 RepID=A0A2I2F5P0_ASPCN|nr:hypothetical protein BDW47DRAFT_119173 [Aspergillus candidus]PLB35979.1 hypothetical protein BDW47DRAFT_119173 [Aspergillus candidus]
MCVRIAINMDIFVTLTERNRPVLLAELAATRLASSILAERVLRAPTGMTRQMTDRLSIAMMKFIFDVEMPMLAKVPEFLRRTDFHNPEGATTGALQFVERTDKVIWDWIPEHPDYMESCNTFMEGDRGSRSSWLKWFPVQERLFDGACTEGDDAVLMVDDLLRILEESTVDATRIEKFAFDLFKPQPIQGTSRIYYMKFILHDWSDEDNQRILRQLAGAMQAGYSKLIIEEFVLADRDCAMLQAIMERSQAQWTRLLELASFRVVKFWSPPGDGQGIIEAELKE